MAVAPIPTRFQRPHSLDGTERDLSTTEDGLPHFVWKAGLLGALEKFYGHVVGIDEVLYLRWVNDEDDEFDGYLEAHIRRRDGLRDVIRFKGDFY